MKPARSWAIIALVCLTLIGCAEKWSIQLKVPRMTREELKSLLGNPDAIIIDVRESEDYKKSEFKIQGAVREDPEKDINAWVNKYPKDKTLIFYCS